MRYAHRFASLFVVIASAFLAPTPKSIAQEVRPQIVGGEFRDLRGTPVALILWETYEGAAQCTGILVGPREVLTAAHCIATPAYNDNYDVFVGSKWHTVAARYYNPAYIKHGPVFANGPFDLGILILSAPVAGTDPLPVLVYDLVFPGEAAAIYGYGTNEISGTPGRNPLNNGKSGLAVITSASNGLLSSLHATGGASSCSGDSGGPMVQYRSGYLGLVGVLSFGINRVFGGSCYLFGSGSFSYVDLQSLTSLDFLANFPGIYYISGYRITIASTTAQLSRKLRALRKATSTSQIAQKSAQMLRTLNRLIQIADGQRSILLRSSAKNLGAAKRASSLSAAKTSVSKATRAVERVNAMGVY